jgi:DNA mismatch repair protein MutS
MVEMAEAATILRHATPRSLVILDEVGRGTSTQDGLALAAAILKDLATRVRCFTLFATHYHELVPFASQLAGVTPMQTEVQEHGDRVVFTHRLKEGASDSSYGIEVARIAGIPEPVLTGARQFLETHVLGVASVAAAPLEKGAASSKASLTAKAKRAVEGATSGGTAGASGTGPVERLLGLAGTPLGLSERAHAAEVLDRLSKLNTNRMTPLQALNLLAEMQARLTVLPQPSLFPEESC